MRLEMRGVDHDPLGIAAPVRQRCENLELCGKLGDGMRKAA